MAQEKICLTRGRKCGKLIKCVKARLTKTGGIVLLRELHTGKRVTGVKQTRRCLRDGQALRVYLAKDADESVTGPVREECRGQEVPVCEDYTMREIGQASGIQVGAAVAALVR